MPSSPTTRSFPIKVLIVDDYEPLRKALAAALRTVDNMLLVGEASNGAQGVQLCSELKPDVVLMDLAMEGVGGIAATRTIRGTFKDVKILIFTSFAAYDQIQEALDAGADGYLFKNCSIDQLVNAIKTL